MQQRRRRAKPLQVRIAKRKFAVAPYAESWHEYEAFENKRLAGRLICFEAPAGSRDCWVHDIWVMEEHRGKGLGTKLLKRALADARTHNYARVLGAIRSYDNASATAVEQLFTSQGFTVVPNWEGTRGRMAVKVF
jgi:GNAT superfamily N-acetyltransferase